jgi:hypothetical protein
MMKFVDLLKFEGFAGLPSLLLLLEFRLQPVRRGEFVATDSHHRAA